MNGTRITIKGSKRDEAAKDLIKFFLDSEAEREDTEDAVVLTVDYRIGDSAINQIGNMIADVDPDIVRIMLERGNDVFKSHGYDDVEPSIETPGC